ncbi:MAG: TonB-dependent receptor [Bacteroidetes bacterium]|nr:TonB-dependent receptor [Bacteroidota bacterium]
MNKKLVAKIFFAGVFFSLAKINAQSILSGNVRSDKGEAIPFAVIGIKNTQLSATTNSEGAYKFKNLKPDTYVLTTRCLGYLDKTDTITVAADLVFDPQLFASNKQLDEVVVNATRVNKNNGMAYSNIDAETLKKQNLGQDAPYMLNLLPSVVVNSDAGAGVGYTGLRIRGSDGTRINVTINGVPVNDAESQGTYFVDMPDLVSSTNNIQVQRGVGASSNGAGAFGASINFQTNELKDKPYANAISTAGSFNTFRNTIAAGTGLLNNKFTLDARASNISSDGYIDRAKSNLQSYYVAAGYYGKKSVLKFINFYGQEKTYQAWYYVLEDSIKKGNRTDNPAGLYYDTNGKPQYYKNETDNYKQNNFQLHFIHQVNSRLSFNLTGHYTKGKGYYEQYKQGQSLSAYNINDVITPKGDTITTSDIIRRLWLDNDFAGGIFNLNYTPNSKLAFTLGGGYNTYYGKHFNRVVWAQYASNSQIDHQYLFNTANKNDGNVYLKTNYKPVSTLNMFIDLQVRNVSHRFLGFNDSLAAKMQNQSYTFFNPKFGVSWDAYSHLNIYASVSMANKEPNRDDFVQSSPKSRPKPEQLMDIEAGVKYTIKNFYFATNVYDMEYKNQLVLNGKVNNVGAYNRVNVASSYRRGIEVEASANLNKFFTIGGNVTISQNKINNFVEYIDSSDAAYTISTQYKKEYKNTDISFSPNEISSLMFVIKPVKNMEITFTNKYVGRQYLDNTTNIKRSISPYYVTDARFNYTIKTNLIPEISFMFAVYNLLSTKYETNGYTYSYYTDATLNTFNYKAPAAPINFLGGISLKF